MKREDVYLDTSTLKKFEEVMEVLLLFEEPIYRGTIERYKAKELSLSVTHMDFLNEEWVGIGEQSNKTLITPEQLGELLSAREEKKTTLGALPKRGKTLIHNTVFNPQAHYDNSDGSLFKLASDLGLNHWEFDIFKRLVRCRKKNQFEQDLQKIKDTVDIYLREG